MPSDHLARNRRLLSLVALPLGILIIIFRFRYKSDFLSFYDDDFFYYLKIANHLATGHKSSFDGTHLTNGYHPLWEIVLTVLVFISGNHFFLLLTIVTIISFAATWELARAILSRLGSSGESAQAIASITSFAALLLTAGGMEVVLVIPIALGATLFRLRQNFKWDVANGITYGTLLALMMLSRLDSVLLAALFGLAEISILRNEEEGRVLVPRLAALCAALLPLIIYAAINLHVFHTAAPVSAQAKQLRYHHWPNAVALRTLLLPLRVSPPRTGFALAKLLCFVWPAALVTLIAAVRLPGALGSFKQSKSVLFALLIFPFVQILTLSILSDWKIWSWYLYPFVLSAIAGASILVSHESAGSGYGRLRRRILTCAAIIYMLGFTFSAYRQSPAHNNLYLIARDLAGFEKSHPGVYAMGDSAGTPGYLMRSPMIQLEGLVMDKEYLDNLRQRRDLHVVFREYGVRYYIATVASSNVECYDITEPQQAGPDSPKMHGRFCNPVAKFFVNKAAVAIFDVMPTEATPLLTEAQATKASR